MSKVMVFRNDDNGLELMLEPLDVPNTVTMDNVADWLLTLGKHYNTIYTVVEVSRTMTYKIKEKPQIIPPPETYVERVPEFSIFNHELNGR